MKYFITVEFEVEGLKDKFEAHEMGVNIATHVHDTFNDNKSISNLFACTVKEKP